MAETADNSGDLYHHSEYMFKGQVYNSKVRPLSHYSIIITLVALLEEGFNTLCRAHQLINKHTVQFTDINGLGLERCIKYSI